jgi:predicted phosphodiesterase
LSPPPRRAAVAILVAALALAGCEGGLPRGWAYVSRVGPTDATVVWTGADGERATCHGPGGATREAAAVARGRGLQVAVLRDLVPAARYDCRLGRPAGRVHFRTAPAADAPFTFAVVGDTGDRSPEAAALARRILASHPAFLLHLGDLAYPAAKAAALGGRFFTPYRRLLARVPIYPTPGNHDFASWRAVYGDVFAPIADGDPDAPRYAFDWGAARFVTVSSSSVAAGTGEATAWLASELEQAARRPWRIVFLHEPPLSAGAKGTSPGLRDALLPVLEAGGADLVLSGHSHLYERSVPACLSSPAARVVQIVSGGGGASLDPVPEAHANFPKVVSATHYLRIRVGPETIDLRAIAVDGHVIDRFRLRRDARPPCRARGWGLPVER